MVNRHFSVLEKVDEPDQVDLSVLIAPLKLLER
jgi:hypothetical protein